MKGQKGWDNCLEDQRILIVEDEFLIAIDLSDLLERHGADVEIAGSVSDGFAALDPSEGRFSMALLDVMVGSTEVTPLALAMRQMAIPFVFHSGHAAESPWLQKTFPDAPALAKPAREAEILEALCGLIPG
ncbi:response regulator [Parvularcula mediterranea]|uniref:hypothetical protein n=1 Tax=Parvularcula mediterranea TaxID=2732508 RepID=UPI00156337ED|nr:hypothetical protein [Parvularcula mediterranea]